MGYEAEKGWRSTASSPRHTTLHGHQLVRCTIPNAPFTQILCARLKIPLLGQLTVAGEAVNGPVQLKKASTRAASGTGWRETVDGMV